MVFLPLIGLISFTLSGDFLSVSQMNSSRQLDIDSFAIFLIACSLALSFCICAKDLALVDTLLKDGFKIPDNINEKQLSAKYDVPKNLLKLIEKKQNAFLALKIVEIIGEDEPYQLDPETIYFVTNLLNKMNLVTIRNKVLNSALPLRT